MKRYIGVRGPRGARILVHSPSAAQRGAAPTYELPPRYDLYAYAGNVDWGYPGLEPAQAALAILADATGDDVYALVQHTAFRDDIIATRPAPHKNGRMQLVERQEWQLTAPAIANWVSKHPADKAEAKRIRKMLDDWRAEELVPAA